jgi:hypothetical protein
MTNPAPTSEIPSVPPHGGTKGGGLKRALLGITGALLLLTACGEVNVFPPRQPRAAAFVTVNLGVIGVDTLSLAKSGARPTFVPLKNLIVTFSSEGDTIRDTLDANSTPRLNVTETVPQTITKRYRLFIDRIWKVRAVTRDQNDSIIHVDSLALPSFEDGDTLRIALNMESRFSKYELSLPSLPDSVVDENGVKKSLCIQRLVLKIDGVIVLDTSVAPGCFAAPLALVYDYVPLGTRNIELEAFGALDGIPATSPLFSGNTSLVATSEGGTSTTLVMNWSGEGSSTASISVTIGKVNKLTLNEEAPDNVFD